jgi:hypothetical protein
MKRSHSFKALTLIETIVALGVTAMVVLTAFSAYFLHQKASQAGWVYIELAQNGRAALDRMSREIRQTPMIVTSLPLDASQPPANELTFQDGHEPERIKYITYYLDGDQLKRRVSYYYFTSDPATWVPYNSKDQAGNSPKMAILEDEVMARHFSSLGFYGEKVINVRFTLQKGTTSLSFQTAIWSRNL